jgi:prepilin-type N-terminal cleavage/methylation domain-containing protein
MRLLHRKPGARRGFTLIEMVVVIAVIAVLVALVAGAVMNIFGKAPALQDRNDITALSGALQQFKAKYNFYPPSRILLSNYLETYTTKPPPNVSSQLIKESLQVLSVMFPNLAWSNPPAIDWAGGMGWPPAPPPGPPTYYPYVILEGDQALVFFLGGIPGNANNTNGCLGFSKSTTNPTAAGGGDRIKFYDFQPARLTSIHNNAFFSYLNPHSASQAYAYFSPGRRGTNQYSSASGTGLGSTDCATLGVTPYANSATKVPNFPNFPGFINPQFVNPDSFQLISAGQNGKFGQGLPLINNPSPPPAQIPPPIILWTPTNVNNIDANGRDDISNFSDRNLGETQ